MSFLAPLFLLGFLSVGLPVLFHLIRRTTRERNLFGSLMFLSPSPPRLTKRTRLEHLLLLALRCGVLCLLAVGFARPFLRQAVSSPPGAARRRIVLLIDTSASMRRANLWNEARKKVESVVRDATPGDQIALFTFSRSITPTLTFEQWNATPTHQRVALASRKLADLSPGWGSTQLGNALIQAAELLADAGGKQWTEPSRIVLITDLQEGAQLEQLQGYEWPKGVEVSVDVLKAGGASNASLQLVVESDEAPSKTQSGVRVRVSNAPGAKREQFKVGWAVSGTPGFAGTPIEVYVPAGQSRDLSIPVSPTSGSVDRVLLQGDDEDFDNSVYTSQPETARLAVIYLSRDSESDSKQGLYFLKRAFQETLRQSVQVISHAPGEPVPASEVQGGSLFVITDPLSGDMTAAMHQLAVAGKTLLVVPNAVEMAATIAGLVGLDRVNLEENRPVNYAMLGEIDFRHPVFAPFADPRFSDFTRIHFWKYYRLQPAEIPNGRVMAKFDNGDPALIEVPVGAGKVLILATGWQPASSQLALSSKFVPLMYSILDGIGASTPLPAQYRVGDVVALGSMTAAGKSQTAVRLPDGSQVTMAAGETNFSRTETPGVYTVVAGDTTKRFAVNLDPAESRTATLPLDELERLGVPSAKQAPSRVSEAERKIRLQNAELENRQRLWRWFLAGTLAVLLVETWQAGRSARRVPGPAQAFQG